MSWIVIALASAAVSGGITIVDKTILQNYVRSYVTYMLLLAVGQSAVGIAFVAIFAWSGSIATADTLWAALSGVLFGVSGLFLLPVLSSQEVSRAAPVAQTAPIFAGMIASFFLDESLTVIQWTALFVTVAGAMLLSVRRDKSRRKLFLHHSFLLLMASSFFFGAGQVVGKEPLETLSVPLVHGVRTLGFSAVFLVVSLPSKEARQELMGLTKSRNWGLALVAGSELMLVSAGFLLFFWALSKGPVGLVSAVGGTRSFFILLYSSLLSLRFRNLLGEEVTLNAVAIKLISITMIVVGVGVITLA